MGVRRPGPAFAKVPQRQSLRQGSMLKRVLKIARSGDRAYTTADSRPFPVGRVPSQPVWAGNLAKPYFFVERVRSRQPFVMFG